jgi:phage gp36-like protein
MSYAIKTDMENRYGTTEIAELESESGKSTTSLTEALKDAAAEIDSYLGQLYQLPLPTGKKYPLLVWISCDIARYRLWENKINDENDTVYIRYKRACNVLAGLLAGDNVLVDEDGAIINAQASDIKVISDTPAFSSRILDAMNYGDT